MNYKHSLSILQKIKEAKRVIIACHSRPDPDSVGSVLAMSHALKQIGIDSHLYSIDAIPEDLTFLPDTETIKQEGLVNFSFEQGDLVIILDMSGYSMLFNEKRDSYPEFEFVRIDHHAVGDLPSNDTTIVGAQRSSTAEILFEVFTDWNVTITSEIATYLLVGIIGDTGTYQYPNTTEKTHRISADLYKAGAQGDTIYYNLYRSKSFETYELFSLYLKNLKLEKEHKFIWTAVSFEDYHSLGEVEGGDLMSPVLQGIVDTDFGIQITEKKPGQLNISFRSRHPEIVNVALLAQQFGGGGHIAASGARIEGNFAEKVKFIVDTAKSFVSSL